MPKATSADREARAVARDFAVLRGLPVAKPATRAQRRRLMEDMSALTGAVPGDTSDPDGSSALQAARNELQELLGRVAGGGLKPDAAIDQVLKAVQPLIDRARDGAGQDDGDGYEADDEDDNLTESVELRELRRERRVVELCESIGFIPTASQIRAVAAIPNRELRHRRARELARAARR
jgi:hypothetical protein